MLKISSYAVLQTQGSVCCKWTSIHCSKWRSSWTWGGSLLDGRWSEEIDTRIGKANTVLLELNRSVVTKRELSNTAKLLVFKSVFVPILTCGHESWAMTERILTQVQASEIGFLRRVHGVPQGRTEIRWRPGQKSSLTPPFFNQRSFGSKCTVLKKTWDMFGTFRRPPVIRRPGHCSPLAPVTPLVWHFVTNWAVVKFAEFWMSNYLSELRDHSYVISTMYPECPTKCWRRISCGLNPRESGPVVVQGLSGVTASPTLLGSVLVWSHQNCLKLLLTVRYSTSSQGCCPRDPP